MTSASVLHLSKWNRSCKDFSFREEYNQQKTSFPLIYSWGNIRFCDLVLIHKNTPYWSLQHGSIVLRLIRILSESSAQLDQWLLKWSRIFQLKSSQKVTQTSIIVTRKFNDLRIRSAKHIILLYGKMGLRKNVIGSWNVSRVISENYVFICVFCESLAGPGFAPVLGGIAIALLEVARFMVMRLIASIIIEGVPISFSSLRAATFYFITAIVKSEVPFSKSGDITIIIPLQTNWIRLGVVCGDIK